MKMTIRPMTEPEQMYCYTQSSQIQGQTGCIGHLRVDMDFNGEGFYYSWDDHREYLNTEQFKADFDEVINRLRFGKGDENGIRKEDENCFLKNRSALAQYCWSQPFARMKTAEENYGFRVDTDNYSYMMRLNPNRGEYNLYCYCYRRDWLEKHMKNAERGIRFVDGNYKDLFRIPDGGKVRVTRYDGKVEDFTCRYIDEWHLEIGFGSFNLLHICELAEKMERNGNKIEPIDVMPEQQRKHHKKEISKGE